MKRAPTLPATDRLLTAKEVGARVHATGRHLDAVVASSSALQAGRRYRGTRAYFLESSVVEHIHYEMSGAPTTRAVGA